MTESVNYPSAERRPLAVRIGLMTINIDNCFYYEGIHTFRLPS
jgi:hypothetical protein